MNISARRLIYTLVKRTQSFVSDATGIPQSTISYVARGLRDLPSEYVESLRNFYQREVYSNLREWGASSIQARRFTWYTPESVLDIESNLIEKVNDLAIGYVGQKIYGTGIEYTEDELWELFGEGKEAIKKGISLSKKPLETIFEVS